MSVFLQCYSAPDFRKDAAVPDSPTVLIVEDHADSREGLYQLLVIYGYAPVAVASSSEALVLLESWRPDYLLLDLMLPDFAGGEVLRHVREKGLSTQVAVVTASTEPRLLAETRALKPDAFFPKPLDVQRFVEWIKNTRRSPD